MSMFSIELITGLYAESHPVMTFTSVRITATNTRLLSELSLQFPLNAVPNSS